MLTNYWNSATIGQKLLWKKIIAIFGVPNTITPLHFQGAIAGSEFLTYDANKVYLAFDLGFVDISGDDTTISTITVHGLADAIVYYFYNTQLVYNGATIRYIANNIFVSDVYFYRIETSRFSRMMFNGYRFNM
jgi:hypothetical protein